MRNYITRLSLSDFKALYPEHTIATDKSPFPKVVVILSETYQNFFNNPLNTVTLTSTKHVYSTRDYWEVATTTSTNRHKIPKKYTKSIYLIEED